MMREPEFIVKSGRHMMREHGTYRTVRLGLCFASTGIRISS